MRDYSEQANADNAARTASKILSEVTRPIFQNSKSKLSLSVYLTACARPRFVISARSVPLIPQSIKGYIQLSRTWKINRRSLDFVPLEQFDEYYYLPEEIEEEIIISSPFSSSSSYNDNRRSVHRNVTTYFPHMEQKKEISKIATRGSIDKEILKVSNRHRKGQPSEISTSHQARHSIRQGKSIETTETPKKDDAGGLSDKSKHQLPLPSKPKKYREKSFSKTFNLEQKAGNQPKLRSSRREYSAILSPYLRLEPSPSPSVENQYQPEPVSTSIEQRKTMVNYDDNDNDQDPNSLQAKQWTNIDTKLVGQIDFEKIPKRIRSPEIMALQQFTDDNKKNDFSKSVQPDIVKQAEDMTSSPSSIAELVNVLRRTYLSQYDNNRQLDHEARNRLHMPFDITTEATVNKSNSISTVNVNRLEVRVIGNNTITPEYATSAPIETIENDDVDLNSYDEYDTVESLNKSYLWRYKAKFW